MTKELLGHFTAQWLSLRSLTTDLLEALTEDELLLTPHPALGCWWKQFRHVGRVQENYLQAIETGTMQFGFEGATYDSGSSKYHLREYLTALDSRLQRSLLTHQSTTIDWFGEQKSLAEHLLYLADHEVLHHGQWIVYRTQLGGSFPLRWSSWGL